MNKTYFSKFNDGGNLRYVKDAELRGVIENTEGFKTFEDNEFTYRKSGGNNDIETGLASVECIKGNTIAWNQLATDGASEYRYDIDSARFRSLHFNNTPSGHKILLFYLVKDAVASTSGTNTFGIEYSVGVQVFNPIKNGIYANIVTLQEERGDIYTFINMACSSGTAFTMQNFMTFDLTLMFGEGNEPTTVAEFETWLANNVGLKDYYEYCPGKLVNFGGYGVKWNQLVRNGNFVDETNWSVDKANLSVSNNIAHITANEQWGYLRQDINITQGHKYMLTFYVKPTTPNTYFCAGIGGSGYFSGEGVFVSLGGISDTSKFTKVSTIGVFTKDSSDDQPSGLIFMDFRSSNFDEVQICDINLIDLTEMFGAGNEPDLEWCNEHFTQDYYPYCSGYDTNLMNVIDDKLGIKSVGFNQWDEEVLLGYYDNTDGQFHEAGNQLCTKNPIELISGKTYYFNMPLNTSIYLYGNDGAYLGNAANPTEYTCPSNVRYIHINFGSNYGAAYNHDICINISNPSKNGTYEPYWESKSDMSWITKIGIENFNIWDEEWEVGGINYNSGEKDDSITNIIRSKNFISVLPNTNYYYKNPIDGILPLYYDANKNYIEKGNWSDIQPIQTTPANCYYIMFIDSSSYGTIYNHDICINKSIPHFNGRYVPYGETASYFPNGLCKAGSVCDEVKVENGKIKGVVRIGSVDLGDLDWKYDTGLTRFKTYSSITDAKGQADAVCSKYEHNYSPISGSHKDKTFAFWNDSFLYLNDFDYTNATTFKTALQGVMLYYELETPYEFEIDYPANTNYNVDGDGTEQLIPTNDGFVINAAPKFNIDYPVKSGDSLLDLRKEYITSNDLDNFLSLLGESLGGVYSKVWNEFSRSYKFGISERSMPKEGVYISAKSLNTLLDKIGEATGFTWSKVWNSKTNSYEFKYCIAPKGDVQVFADPECTKYATGLATKVYVRLNRDYGFGESCTIGRPTMDNTVSILCPQEGTSDEPYVVAAYVDYISEDFTQPFKTGQVVECSLPIQAGIYDVSEYDKVFIYIPEFVDFGLPSGTLWAKSNLGTTYDNYPGKYFSWGNINGVTSQDPSAITQTAYPNTPGAGLTGNIPNNAEYDAALVGLGSLWSIPTKEQWQELIEYCDTEKTQRYGVNGYLIKYKTNSNISIFLPMVGFVNGSISGYNNMGAYWSKTIMDSDNAYILQMINDESTINPNVYHPRYLGYSIRPVINRQ